MRCWRGTIRAVSRRLVKNPGARVSASGFAIVVAQAETDPELAVDTGIRVDLPPELRTQLLRNATDAVRDRLLSRAPPHMFEEIRNSIAKVSASVDREMARRATSPRPSIRVAAQRQRQAQ